jgi:hypothetical protein
VERVSNPYRGEIEIQFNGYPAILVFDWHAISVMQKEFGEEWFKVTEKMGSDLDLASRVVAIGLRKHMPTVTPEMVMDASPPIVPVIRAVMEAITACMGTKVEPNPPQPPPAET